MGSFRTRERELRIPGVGTAFDLDDRVVDCKLKQLPWMCLVEPSKGIRREVNRDFERFELSQKGRRREGNKDFERFELSPKEKKQEKQWKMSVSHLVRALLWRGELSKRTALAKQYCIWKQLHCKHERKA